MAEILKDSDFLNYYLITNAPISGEILGLCSCCAKAAQCSQLLQHRNAAVFPAPFSQRMDWKARLVVGGARLEYIWASIINEENVR